MSVIGSDPDGLARIGWRRLAVTGLGFCLAPAVVGGMVLAVAYVLGPDILGERYLRAEGLATFAVISPLVGVPIWVMMVLGAAGLLKIGRFGWLPAVVLGMLAFGVLVRTEIGTISLPFGAVSALLFRMALALQRPEAI